MQQAYTTTQTEERLYAGVMTAFAGILFAVVFPAFVLTTLFAALGVAIYRGPQFVCWRSPSECVSLLNWAAFEWHYDGIGGLRSGVRALGVEVAFLGVVR